MPREISMADAARLPQPALAVPSLFTGGAPAVIADLFSETLSGRKFGLLGDGSDQTAGLNKALAVAAETGKRLELASGAYGVNPSDTDRCLSAPGGISIRAEGRERVVISPMSGATAAHSIFKIAPTSPASLEFIDIEGLMIYPGASGVKRGGKGLHIDTTGIVGGLNLAFLKMSRCYFTPGNDYSVFINNDIGKQGQGAPSNSLFEGCIFYDGFYIRGGGDSNSWRNCGFRSSSPDRNMVDLALVSAGGNGASVSIFDQCNIGDLGSIIIRAGRRITFNCLNAELGNVSGSTGGTGKALIDISGDIDRVRGVKFTGDGLGAVFGNSTATRIIRVDNASDVDIDNLELSSGQSGPMAAAIEITPNAIDTHVGWLSSLNKFNFTALVNDNGVGTRGVTKAPASLGAGFANAGFGYSPASFRKDRFGRVSLSGLLSCANVANGTVIFTLPVGFRPPQIERRAAGASINGGQVVAVVDINIDGTVVYQGATGITQLLLGGLSFQTETFHTSA